MDIYEMDLIKEVNKTLDGIYDDISHLDQYPLSVSKKVLGILIQNACLGQNCGPIELGRKKIREINNRDWLIKYFIEVANRIYTFYNEKENKDVYMVALRDEAGNLIGYYEKHEYRNRETEEPYKFT